MLRVIKKIYMANINCLVLFIYFCQIRKYVDSTFILFTNEIKEKKTHQTIVFLLLKRHYLHNSKNAFQ